jgi:hypothetical protein
MGDRDRQALEDILTVLDRALRFPRPDFETLEATDFLQDVPIKFLSEGLDARLGIRSPSAVCPKPIQQSRSQLSCDLQDED